MRIEKRQIPWLMAAGRALLGPVLIVGDRCGWNGFALATLIVTALVSDIYDGVLARRWHCDTPGVRLFDSMADTFFYACVVAALWMGQPVLWATWRTPVLSLVALEAARIGFDMLKFGKPASYHSYLAKTWGLVLAVAVVTVFALGHATVLMALAIALGVACNVEGLAMSLMLPKWRRDVKTLAIAWRMRRELQLGVASVRSFKAAVADKNLLRGVRP
jgi:CDP-diacylglycerol--glycerol-3-phosphate 3-phosphatidyltransferase